MRAGSGAEVIRRGRFWRPGEGGRVLCLLCHRHCSIAPGASGVCGVRRNEGGALVLPYYGRISSAAVDPVEKKPLFHFRPGGRVFSIGFTGCNLVCPFCQNWTISQDPDAPTEYLSPRDAVRAARDSGCSMIAYTYSEPLVHAEYVLDCMDRARAEGLENVLVTNGHALEDPAREILDRTDAANVDLKTWDPRWYRSELGGDLAAVRRFLEIAAERTRLEVTTLVIPDRNDDDESMRGIAGFLAGLSPDLPLHLSAYRPMYKYRLPPTPPDTLERLAGIARERLRYVYLGNVPGQEDTLCTACGALLVRREGYRTSLESLVPGGPDSSACGRCGAPVPIVPPRGFGRSGAGNLSGKPPSGS